MSDRGEEETIEHIVLQCEKYSPDRWVTMQDVLSGSGCEGNELVRRAGKE